jgi:ribosomal protein S27AE
MDRRIENKNEETIEAPKCKKCGATLISERQKERGLCGKCYMETMRTTSYENITTKEEVELVGLRIKRGDVLRVVLGRNREIIGQFYAWSPTLCAMTIVTESGYVIVPYKYIKAIFIEGE